MFKRILVPTDGSESSVLGMRYAVALAAKHGATILGLYVADVTQLEGSFPRDLSASLGTAPYVNYPGNFAAFLEERGGEALELLRSACAEAGVVCDIKQATGMVPATIAEYGDLADLIVVGRGGGDDDRREGRVGSTVAAVIRKSPRPVLVTGIDTPRGGQFLAAYDGTHPARKALTAAAGIASDWKMPLHLLAVGGEEAEAWIEEAREYLSAHAIEVNYERRPGEPGTAIAEYAVECGAVMLVMGAFGHTRVRELVLGSTTAHAINHAPCPVLLAR